MESDGSTAVPIRHRLRIWVRRVWLLGLLLPALAFGLSNLWLASAWGRATLAGRIQQRCGLDTRIGSASWSPWNGITLGRVEIAQPATLREQVAKPLLEIDLVRIQPVWSALLKRRLSIRTLTVDQPRLVPTVEMMSHLAQQVEVAPSMPLAAATPGPSPSAVPGSSPPDREPGPAAGAKPAVPPAAAPAAAPPPAPTCWLHLRSASFQLCSAADRRVLLKLDGLDGDLPLAGAPASSTIGVKTLAVGGEEILSGFHARLAWQDPVLTLQPDPVLTRVAGLEVRCGGQLALLPGLPAHLSVELPLQPISLAMPRFGLSVEAGAALVQARFLGGLLVPGSWQGDLVGTASGIDTRYAGEKLAFDEASCTAVIRGGMLSCPDLRLVGDDLSLLGNGTLLADGRVAAVLRLVAPPETAAAVARRVFPDLASEPRPTPLSTPQRVALDLSLSGTIQQPLLTLGEEIPPDSLEPPPTPP
ncbi:MAG: hypothetical protein K9M97_04460 [Akkermansiaceae bacterium]|nr:hypothetical protein [Akkermansiaceae bacterium]